jgi:hypothetical protein
VSIRVWIFEEEHIKAGFLPSTDEFMTLLTSRSNKCSHPEVPCNSSGCMVTVVLTGLLSCYPSCSGHVICIVGTLLLCQHKGPPTCLEPVGRRHGHHSRWAVGLAMGRGTCRH